MTMCVHIYFKMHTWSKCIVNLIEMDTRNTGIERIEMLQPGETQGRWSFVGVRSNIKLLLTKCGIAWKAIKTGWKTLPQLTCAGAWCKVGIRGFSRVIGCHLVACLIRLVIHLQATYTTCNWYIWDAGPMANCYGCEVLIKITTCTCGCFALKAKVGLRNLMSNSVAWNVFWWHKTMIAIIDRHPNDHCCVPHCSLKQTFKSWCATGVQHCTHKCEMLQQHSMTWHKHQHLPPLSTYLVIVPLKL